MSAYTILDANKVSKTISYNEVTDVNYRGFNLSELVVDSLTHNAVIIDISSTIEGEFYYYSSNDVSGVIRSTDLPFLISDKQSTNDISCNIYFVPDENTDGDIKLTYFKLGDETIIRTSTDLPYNIFNKMSTQKYMYYKVNDGSYILSTNSTTTDVYDLNTGSGSYSNTNGIPILNIQNSSLYTTYTDEGLVLYIDPKNPTIYDISENYYYTSANYYRAPDILEEDLNTGLMKTYAIAPNGSVQYMIDYNVDPSGAIYTLADYTLYRSNPSHVRTRINLDSADDTYTYPDNSNKIYFYRDTQKYDDNNNPIATILGAITSKIVFYNEKQNSIYTPIQLTITHTHSNNAPVIENSAELFIKNGNANYNQDTAALDTNLGRSISSIVLDTSLNYVEFNTLYDASGIAFTNPGGDISGSWYYKVGTGSSWNLMPFTNPVWYFSTKNETNEMYIKFIPTENKDGTATIQMRAWDLTEGYESNNNPKSASLFPVGGSSSLSTQVAILKQPIVKVNRAPIINTGINTSITMIQDTDLIIKIDDTFLTSTIGFIDESGPARGIVVTDICGGDYGSWYYGILPIGASSVSSWNLLNTSGLHIKEFNIAVENVIIKFSPKKYRFGNVSIKIRGWDQYVDIQNGSFANISNTQIGGYGTYSTEELMFDISISNTDDAPVFVDNSGVEITADISGLYNTYQQGFTPSSPLSEGTISISDILARFSQIFGVNIKSVEENTGLFTDYQSTNGVPNLGITIDQIITATDLSSVALIYDNGGWQDISASLINIENGRSLNLTNQNKIGFRVPMMFKGDNALQVKFRVWNFGNQNTINQRPAFELQSATGNYYSLPVIMNLSYSDANDAPVIDISSAYLDYTFDISQNEGLTDGINLSITTLIDNLIALQINGSSIIKDLDGDYTRIPKFGFAFYSVGETVGFANPGKWKYRVYPNGPANDIDISGGAFHICVADSENPQIYFEPANKNIYGIIQLRAYLWDRSNIIGTENGTVANYSKAILSSQRGLLTAYSIKPVYLNYIINPVNDRPIVTRGALRLAPIPNNAYDTSGQSLYEVMRLNNFLVEDPDPTDLGKHGIAITSVCSQVLGIWQYSTAKVAGVYNWQNIPDNSTNALHLDPILNDLENIDTRIRFIPNIQRVANRSGVRMFQYVVWDKSNDAQNGDFISIDTVQDNSYSLIVYNGRISVI